MKGEENRTGQLSVCRHPGDSENVLTVVHKLRSQELPAPSRRGGGFPLLLFTSLGAKQRLLKLVSPIPKRGCSICQKLER